MRRAWDAYCRQLEQRPVVTQTVVSGVIWGAGDALVQRLSSGAATGEPAPDIGSRHLSGSDEQALSPHSGSAEHGASKAATQAATAVSSSSTGAPTLPTGGSSGCLAMPSAARRWVRESTGIDMRRVLGNTLFGLGWGVVGHYWYHALDRVVSTYFRKMTVPFITAKLFGETVLMGPCYLGAYLAFMGKYDGDSNDQLWQKLKADFVPTYLVQTSYWIIYEGLNFRFVPVKHQLLSINLFCIVDAGTMSWVKHHKGSAWEDVRLWLLHTSEMKGPSIARQGKP